jgi:poly(3-hydroxybutyrate) depolymerase
MSARPVTLAAILILAATAATGEPGKVSKEKISFKERQRVYFLFVPTGTAPERKLPVVVTLHGSGQDAETYVSAWKDLAEKEKILVVGPASNDSIHWASPEDGPLLLHDIVEQVSEKRAIDGRRVYLFGHSAGAVFALQMAALEADYFAAAAAYAGSLEPKYFNIFDYATRKIPYLMVIGTRDRIFSLEEVRATRDGLKSRGFPVEYVEMSGQTHNYVGSAKEINGKAWEFFQKNPLPADPKYTVYWDPAKPR